MKMNRDDCQGKADAAITHAYRDQATQGNSDLFDQRVEQYLAKSTEYDRKRISAMVMMKMRRPRDGFRCGECLAAFPTLQAAENAAFGDHGCGKCGSTDVIA